MAKFYNFALGLEAPLRCSHNCNPITIFMHVVDLFTSCGCRRSQLSPGASRLPPSIFMYYMRSLILEGILKSSQITLPISSRYVWVYMLEYRTHSNNPRWSHFILKTVPGKKKPKWCLEVSTNPLTWLKFCSCSFPISAWPHFASKFQTLSKPASSPLKLHQFLSHFQGLAAWVELYQIILAS